jgi:hypothetical protein
MNYISTLLPITTKKKEVSRLSVLLSSSVFIFTILVGSQDIKANAIEAIRSFPFGMDSKTTIKFLDTNSILSFDRTKSLNVVGTINQPYVKDVEKSITINEMIIGNDTILDVRLVFLNDILSAVDYKIQFESNISKVLKGATFYLGKSIIKKGFMGTAYGAKINITHHDWEIHDKSIRLSISEKGDFQHEVKFTYEPIKEYLNEVNEMNVSLVLKTSYYDGKIANTYTYNNYPNDTLKFACEAFSGIELEGNGKGIDLIVECSNGKLLRMIKDISLTQKKSFKVNADFSPYCPSIIYDVVDEIEYSSTRFSIIVMKDNIILYKVPIQIDFCTDYE